MTDHELLTRIRALHATALRRRGVTFLKNQRVPLMRLLPDPGIPLENGEAERSISGPVVGRKNFAGSRTERGARAAELLYSLLQSAVMEGVDPVD